MSVCLACGLFLQGLWCPVVFSAVVFHCWQFSKMYNASREVFKAEVATVFFAWY